MKRNERTYSGGLLSSVTIIRMTVRVICFVLLILMVKTVSNLQHHQPAIHVELRLQGALVYTSTDKYSRGSGVDI